MSERGAGSRGPLIVAAVIGVVAIVVVRLAMTWGDGDDAPDPGVPFTARDGCTTVVVAASSEKAGLLGQLSQDYAASGRTVQGSCYDIKVITKASGAAEAALARGWNPAADGEQPDVWTPAASTWVRLLEHDLQRADRPDLVPDDVQSVASTPLVLAMPRPMAESLGWPATAVGWADILKLANDPKGWAAKGHPEWGNFKLGKTNPNISTSGLAATVGAFVAATGQSSDLTERDLVDKKVRAFVKSVERSVVHYGDTTLTFLANLQRADDAGTGLGYVSAVAVEEKSVLDYNAGNPTGNPATAGQHAPPKVPLVAIYPKEGTLFSDNPWVVLDAPWSQPQKKAGARDFFEFLRTEPAQRRFTDAGFRTHDGTPGAPITSSAELRADGVKVTLSAPSPAVLDKMRTAWGDLRKPARVLLLLDASGSMSEQVPGSGGSRMDLAKVGIGRALDQFEDQDHVGVWMFTTDLPGGITEELLPIGAVAKQRRAIEGAVQSLQPLYGTPLYASIEKAVGSMKDTFDPGMINAVVVLTDGKNEYGGGPNVDELIALLGNSEASGGLRVFSVAYSSGADLDTLKRISEASQAAAYDATNAASIDQVMTAVISNF